MKNIYKNNKTIKKTNEAKTSYLKMEVKLINSSLYESRKKD